MNQEGSVLHVTSDLKISSRIDEKYLQDEHSLDEHFEVNGKIFNESNFLCINCGPQVSILRNRNGSKYSFWSADQTTRDTVTKITCIIEVNIGTGVPLLAAGTDEGLLCFYYTGVSRILRAVQFGQKIVSLALLDNGDHSAVGNWVTLPEELQMMNGVLAVGLDGGAVYLVDMCHHWLKLSIKNGGPVTIEIPSQLLLINLRTDTANDIQAKKEYADCHPGETLAIFLNESNLDQFRKVMTSHLGSPVYRRSLDNSVEEFHLVVTALAYFKEIACLAVGFNTGCFQLWHMSLFRLIYMSPLMQDTQLMPVAGFSWQEPTDDPHSVCFIWAAHHSPSHLAARPFAAMYMASFTTKRHIDGYGCFYENYKACQRKYELGLGDDMDSVIDGRIISCQSISKLIQRRLPHCSIQASNEDESIVSVCAIAWEVWTPERTNVTSKLTLFDINQWYRAQMPYSLESGGSNSYVANLLLPTCNEEHPEPLLDVCISAESLSQFSAYQPLDEHYFPLSLSLACTCLYEHRKVECAWKGVQMELLTALDQAGPSALIDPSRYCNRFLAVGLKPSFYDANDSANLSVVTERQMLLTVMVEQGWMSFVCDCVRAWADGCLAVANCTLPTLLKWGWSAVTFYKQMADNICIQLFDLRTTPSLKEFIYVVSLLHKLSEMFDFILKNYRNFILEDNVELQSISLQLYIEYLDSVVWSTKHHLLPEVNEPSASLPHVFQYPQFTLQNNVIERREKMRQLSRKLLEVNPQLCLADLLVVDSLLKTTAGGRRIVSQWEAEGSAVGGLYPPPSLQSILRIFLVRGVATHFKHMLIYYFLLDVVDLQQDHPSAAKMLQNFVTKFRLTKSQVLITKAFWLIDHGKLKEAVEHFTNNTVCQNDMTETNHKTVMHSLFVQGEPKLALIYSRAFNPLLSELEDAKFHILILLECGHILQAFDFQRKYRQWQTELLDLFFTVCMRRKELGIVYKLSLDSSEEEAFTQFLEANRHPRSEDLRVLYLLSRARYVEAIDVNKKLAVKRVQGPTPMATPVLERRTPLKGIAFRKGAAPRPKDDESRDQIRDVIVTAFAKTLPPITRELADFCSRQKNTLGSWKKVDRPDPLSVAVNQQPLQTGLKERFVELALAKTRQTWAPLLATPFALKSRMRSTVEDTPFLRSTPFSVKTARTSGSPRTNAQLDLSAKRGLGCDEVDEPSLLKSESRMKRARLDFDDVIDKKKEKEDGALLLSTPFIKRKRAAIPSEMTPRTPLSILKSPWKSGQSSVSRYSERSDAPSSPMPRQIRFSENIESEKPIDKRSSSIRFDGNSATSSADSAKETIQELSETDEDIDMTSTTPLTQSDSENDLTQAGYVKVTFSLDTSTQRESGSEDVIKSEFKVDTGIDSEQPQSSQPEEESSVIDIPSSDDRVDVPSSDDPIDIPSSDDRLESSPVSAATSRFFNEGKREKEDKERFEYDEEKEEEQKTYQDLSTASVFVNVTGELESSVFEELEDGEIDANECDPLEPTEDSVISKDVVYNSEVAAEAQEEAEEINDVDDSKIDIYAGIDDDEGDVGKEGNYEPEDDELYKDDEYIENYRQDANEGGTGKNKMSSDKQDAVENRRELSGNKKEEEARQEEDEDSDDQVICLDDSSNSEQQEEPVTVIPKRNRISSEEEELDYDESRMYGDEDEEEGEGNEVEDEEEGEGNEFEDEEEGEEEEFVEEEEFCSDDDDEECMSEEEEEEEEDSEDEEEYARRLSEEEENSNESNKCANINKESSIKIVQTASKQLINPFFKNKGAASTSSSRDSSDIVRVTSTEEGKNQDNVEKVIQDEEEEATEGNVEEVIQDNHEDVIQDNDEDVIQDNVEKVTQDNVEAIQDNAEERIQDNVEEEVQDDDCQENVESIRSVPKHSDDKECEPIAEEIDHDNFELRIDEITGNASALESEHNESFGKLEMSYEEESDDKQVEVSTKVEESGSEVVESRLDTIQEVSAENRTEVSSELINATNKISQSDIAVKSEELETNLDENSQPKDDSHYHTNVIDDSNLSTPLRTRQNRRRSSSEVPPSRDLKLRRSARKSISSNRLNDLTSTTEDKNVSKDFFDNSPTVPLGIQSSRSRRSSSVVHTPSKATRQSLRKSISSSLLPDVTKTVPGETSMDETLKTSRLNSLKDSDSSTIIEEKSDVTLKNSGQPVVESMVIDETATFDITNKTNNVQETIVQEKTEISDNKTTTDQVGVDETLKKEFAIDETLKKESEIEVDETLKKESEASQMIVEESGSVVETSVKSSSEIEESTGNVEEENSSKVRDESSGKVEEESSNKVEGETSSKVVEEISSKVVEETSSKVEEREVADQLIAATTVSDSYSLKDIKRPSSRGTVSEAPESVYNEPEEPVVAKPLQRRAASVSKLDEESGKLDRIRRSSRRYRSGMVWSEYSKNVDSYKKLQLNLKSVSATSVSSALDVADDVSLASVRESLSSATTATSATNKKLRHSRFRDRSRLRTAFRSFDVLLSDEEDDTAKSAAVNKKRPLSPTSSVISDVGSLSTVAGELSPIKNHPNEEETLKETETHNESMITIHEEQDDDIVNETNAGKVESVIPMKARKAKTETNPTTKRRPSTQSIIDSDEEDMSLTELKNKETKSTTKGKQSTQPTNDSNEDMTLTELKNKETKSTTKRRQSTQSMNDSDEDVASTELKNKERKSTTKRRQSTQPSNDSDEDISLTELKNKVLNTRKSVAAGSKADKEASKPVKRSRSISSLSATSKRTQSNNESEEESSVGTRLRRGGRISRSESPVGVRKLPKRSSTVDGDLFGNDSPDTTLTKSLKTRIKRDLRRSKLLDCPPSRSVLDVILSENEEEDEEEDEDEDTVVDDEKKGKKPVKKRGKEVEDGGRETPPPKGKRGKVAKTAILSDVESTPATPKRTRRTKQEAEDSDVSISAASSSKQPRRGRRSSSVALEMSPAKARLFSSPESVASTASTSKKRKRLSTRLMPVSSTPETHAQSDVSVIDSSIIESRRLTRHQLANMQKFAAMHAAHSDVENTSIVDHSSSRRLTRHQPKLPFRHETMDESSILDADSDADSAAEGSVSSVMSTRSSARLRMKSLKK